MCFNIIIQWGLTGIMEICKLGEGERELWEKYVKAHPIATFYHQFGWKSAIEKSYGHRAYYLMAKEDGKVVGVLPLFHIKSHLFGNKLVSVPFAPYGGVCADNEKIEHALVSQAQEITRLQEADYLELRNSPFDTPAEQKDEEQQVTSILHLDPDPENVWKGMKKNRRRGISKAMKADVEVLRGTELVDEFYDMYIRRMRSLGSPVHSQEFFRNIVQEFPDSADIVIAKHKGKTISGIFLLSFRDCTILSWGASDDRYLKYYPVDLSYWEAIKYSCQHGYKYFDFGRSMPDSGVHEYKKAFGSQTQFLDYRYYLNSIDEIPNNTTSSKKRQKFSNVWKKMPLPLTRLIGPQLRKEFP